MSPEDVLTAAYDALESALKAGTPDAAVAAVRADLEVLDREDLLRVAVALAVESTLRLPQRVDRPVLGQRLTWARANLIWGGSA